MRARRWLYLPSLEPSAGWTLGAVEMLVDVSPYVGGVDWRWVEYLGRAPGDMAVYPFKGRVPGRGEGQWKREEVRCFRIDLEAFEATSRVAVEMGDRHGRFPP